MCPLCVMLNIDWVGENMAKITNLPQNAHRVSTSSHPTNHRELFNGLQICSPKITLSHYWTFSCRIFSCTSYSSISYNPLDLTLNLDIFSTSDSVTTNHQPPPCPLTYRHSDLVTSNHPLPHILNWNFS